MHIKEIMGSYFKNIVTPSSLIICTDDTQDHTWTVHFYSSLILMRFEDLVPMTMSNAQLALTTLYVITGILALNVKAKYTGISHLHYNFGWRFMTLSCHHNKVPTENKYANRKFLLSHQYLPLNYAKLDDWGHNTNHFSPPNFNVIIS